MEKLAKEKEVVGIYLSGHPLDDFKYEMKYFCNSKLESLKDLNNQINKNLSFGGIVSNVKHLVNKSGKGWGSFVLEGYDESHEFRIFGEEYMKFRHYLTPNSFTFIKLMVKEGWPDKETGKRRDPIIQFIDFKILQDILGLLAKKLVIHININDLKSEFVHQLSTVFQQNKGDKLVVFEVMELEKIKKQIEITPPIVATDEDSESEVIYDEENPQVELVTEMEEIKVITKLEMPSRKLKIKISNELLSELEKLQVNFKLN
jgi:DNA polymerase-3 subunit alpha